MITKKEAKNIAKRKNEKSKTYKPKNIFNYNLTPRYGSLVGNAGLHTPSGVFSTILLGGII